MNQQLHFTFGPVQEFVSEARKTVDLWTGSYLISYLAARAIDGALGAAAREKEREKDFFPKITDNPLLEAVRDTGKRPGDSTQPAASVGSLPNRFSVLVGSEEEGKHFAEAAENGLRSAWKHVSDTCWWHLTKRHGNLKKHGTGIWERQIESLWEISWVLSEDPRALTERKLMRAFGSVGEPGRKCTVCGRREELGNRNFWQPLSERLGPGFLKREKERLCAVCLIKRTLPRVGRKAFGWEVMDGSFPSTPDLAVDPWMRKIARAERLQEAREEFSRAVDEPFDEMQGTYFFPSYYEDEEVPDEKAESLKRALPGFLRSVGTSPRPTYAILAMDGDNMGAKLSRLDEQGRTALSERILTFSLGVRDVVEDGETKSRLVYAGGEDVLALLPMDRALEVAWKVRSRYREVFQPFDESHRRELEGQPSTISAGLLFCPMSLPLRTATREAHRLLDEEAKDRAHRDALAVGAWKGGGEILTLARKWDHQSWVEELMEITVKEELPYPSRFLYQAQEIIRQSEEIRQSENKLDLETQKKLLALEYYGSREEKFRVESLAEAEDKIKSLIEMSTEDGSLNPRFFRLVRFFFEEGGE